MTAEELRRALIPSTARARNDNRSYVGSLRNTRTSFSRPRVEPNGKPVADEHDLVSRLMREEKCGEHYGTAYKCEA